MLSINQVSFPKLVNAGQQFKIEVTVESNFYFEDLEQMTWNTVENRALVWNNIDETWDDI
ncbi:hypothetical protein [Schinkia azotoformans]|uniref:hypothetical protein n=1 Tax=Schinkia azotoformans TaxID=1454 RepID=UPI002DB73AA2|nr:hypothetical protein [Schinkia azotoformans]MEC1744103.1 hypothetical protein [Schinkia azotoformans]